MWACNEWCTWTSAWRIYIATNLNLCLQIVVLARVIVDRDQVSLSAEGVTKLVGLLKSENANTVILAGKIQQFMASKTVLQHKKEIKWTASVGSGLYL